MIAFQPSGTWPAATRGDTSGKLESQILLYCSFSPSCFSAYKLCCGVPEFHLKLIWVLKCFSCNDRVPSPLYCMHWTLDSFLMLQTKIYSRCPFVHGNLHSLYLGNCGNARIQSIQHLMCSKVTSSHTAKTIENAWKIFTLLHDETVIECQIKRDISALFFHYWWHFNLDDNNQELQKLQKSLLLDNSSFWWNWTIGYCFNSNLSKWKPEKYPISYGAGIGTDKYASRTMKEACKINVSRYLENNARELKKC